MCDGGEWRPFHGDQAAEYQALALAIQLAGMETACQCASFGGPQIMGFNHAIAGHESAAGLFRAFGRSERWQVLAFFDFCAAKDILPALRWPRLGGFRHRLQRPRQCTGLCRENRCGA